MGISLSKWTFTKLQHLSLPMRRTTTLYWSRTVWSPASTWWSWPKTAKPQEMEVSTPGLIIPLYRMGEYNICLGFGLQVFPHFPQGKLSEQNTWALVKIATRGRSETRYTCLAVGDFHALSHISLALIITKEVPVVYFRIVLIRVDPYAWCTSFFRVFDPQWLRAAFSWTATGNRAPLSFTGLRSLISS